MRYHVIVTVCGEGFHLELEVPGIRGMQMAEQVAEMYLREGYRHREPDGWVYYPAHIIQQITIRGKS